MTQCPVCDSDLGTTFSAQVLQKHEVAYRHCDQCGFICTEKPYWLSEAYSDAIVVEDTGLMQRNFVMAARLASVLYFLLDGRGRYVDIAGGYGVLVRLMRDLGLDFYWSDKYSENLMARGFEVEKTSGPFTAITAFEVLEHVEDPAAFIAEKLRTFDTRNFIFSTLLYEGAGPPSRDWWYYAFDAGQHISFYQERTLRKLADRLDLHFCSAHRVHLFSEKPVNRALFSFLTSAVALPLALYVRQRLSSKTVADQDRLTAGRKKSNP